MPTKTLQIPTADGRADAFAAFPDHGERHPRVLLSASYATRTVTLQLWIMRSGGGEMGTALFVGAFNISIALGSFTGGRVVDGVSISAVMWVGAALAVAGAAVAGISGRSRATGS